uniref:Uncharacterized protein n=1 Tax=Anguilla anguilla TaxID=7936 RepID=A0A0E9TR02_ANGAN
MSLLSLVKKVPAFLVRTAHKPRKCIQPTLRKSSSKVCFYDTAWGT